MVQQPVHSSIAININAPRILIWFKQDFTEKCNTHRNKINNMLEGSSDIYPCKYQVESNN